MAILTVDPAGGGDYTTIAAAYAAATSVDTIRLINNDIADETLNLNKNIAGFDADVPTRKWQGNSNFFVVQTGAAMTQQIFFRGFQMVQLGRGNTVKWNQRGSESFLFEDMVFDASAHAVAQAADNFFLNAVLGVGTDIGVFKRCQFIGNSTYTEHLMAANGNLTDTGNFRIENCIFRDNSSGFAGIFANGADSDNVMNVSHCTFENCAEGIQTDSRMTVKNCLFINNVDDVNITGAPGTDADFTYCAFEQQGSPFGSNNIFSITSTNEVVDETNNDFHMKKAAQSRDAGTNLSILDDIEGNMRPASGPPDIGAYEYFQMLMNNGEVVARMREGVLIPVMYKGE
jgi:hypothetical protein